jgi:hypothetical protein
MQGDTRAPRIERVQGATWNTPTQISFNIDPAHTWPASHGRIWWLTIGPISLSVTIPEFGSSPILAVIGGFAADDRSKSGLTGLTIDYGSALDTIETLLSKLQALTSFCRAAPRPASDVSRSNGKRRILRMSPLTAAPAIC